MFDTNEFWKLFAYSKNIDRQMKGHQINCIAWIGELRFVSAIWPEKTERKKIGFNV